MSGRGKLRLRWTGYVSRTGGVITALGRALDGARLAGRAGAGR